MKSRLGFISIAVAFVLLIVSTQFSANAEVLFNDSFMRLSGLNDEGIKTIHMIDYVADTCYAYLDDESIRTFKANEELTTFCQLPAIQSEVSSKDQLVSIVTHMVSGPNGLYGYNIYTGQFGSIDSDGIHWKDVTLAMDCLHPYGDEATYRIARSFVTESKLFVFVSLTEYKGEEDYAFYSFDLASGAVTPFEVSDAVGACHEEGENFLFLCHKDEGWFINKLDTATGSVSLFPADLKEFQGTATLCGLAYDASKRMLCLASKGNVYCSTSGGAFQTIYSISTGDCFCEAPAWILSDGRYALCSINGLYITDAEQSTGKASQLTVQGQTSMKMNQQFQNAWPETALYDLPDTISAEDLAQKLLNQDDSVDVYMIPADYTYASLKKKGMLMDLSSSRILTQEMHAISPDIVGAITDSTGRMIAYPAALNINVFGIHKGYWQMVFGESPLPTTMDEVMDAWILWEERYAEDYPDLDMWYGFNYQQLCQNVITYFVQTHDTGTGTVDILNPSLQTVLSKLAQVYELRVKNGRCLTEWTPDEQEGRGAILSLFASQEAMYSSTGIYAMTQENTLYDQSIFDYSTIYLSWGKDDPSMINGRLWVYVVNPFSKNVEEALHYLECATQLETNPYLYYAIHPDCNIPYERPDMQSKLADIQEKMAVLEKNLLADDIDPVVRRDTQAMVDYYAKMIDSQEQVRWLISKDTITQQRELLSKLNLHMDSVYLTAFDNTDVISDLCTRYTEKSISTDTFLKLLAGKMSMIETENR